MDPRCRKWWTAQVALVVIAGLIGLPVLPLFLGPWLVLAPVVWVALGVIALVVVPRVRWSIHRWEETDTAVYSRSGLFWEEWRAAPLSRGPAEGIGPASDRCANP